MALILYLPLTDGPGEELYKVVKRAAVKSKVELYRSIEEISKRLRRPVFHVKAAVLLAADREDLRAITSLGDLLLLRDMRIILVLPDHDPETIAKGHLLRPRFMAWLDDDFTALGMILKKILSLHDDPLHGTARSLADHSWKYNKANKL